MYEDVIWKLSLDQCNLNIVFWLSEHFNQNITNILSMILRFGHGLFQLIIIFNILISLLPLKNRSNLLCLYGPAFSGVYVTVCVCVWGSGVTIPYCIALLAM